MIIASDFEIFGFLTLRLDPNYMHSVLPKCSDSLLSTSQSEQYSRIFPSLFAIWSGLCNHRHIREAYSLDQCLSPYR